jgi:hypothetical protein
MRDAKENNPMKMGGMRLGHLLDVSSEFGTAAQQQNGGQMEEPPRSTNHPDQYPLRQYLAEQSDPELRPVLHLIRQQNCT